ncbi:hypothetical protein ACWDHW_13320 [Streptomyces melanosporofaciens]
MAATDPTEALQPLAAVIERTLRTTPVQLGTPEGITDLTAALTTAVAIYTARHVLPPGALDDLRRTEAGQAGPAVTRARDEGAIEALRTAAEHVRLGAAVGPIPLEARPAVAAWLGRLVEQRLDRERKRASEALHAALAEGSSGQ